MIRTVTLAFLGLVACAPKTNTPPDEPAPTTAADTTPPAGDAGAEAGDAGAEGGAAAPCKKTGCSGIVCAEEDVVSTCEFKPEYACYQQATCERQPDGACGWTKTAELDACLANPPAP
jgi:hypothetical protein